MHMDREGGIFRNRKPGQEARRDDLLRKRRDDLALLPHAMRRVYVGRFARMVAGALGFVTGLVLLSAAFSPAFYAWFEPIMPGPQPAVLSTLLAVGWLSIALGYFLARSAGEHRFAVAMSRCVLPGGDLETDVERLAYETPGAVGHRMARRIEVRASCFPVAAMAMLLPATLVYLYLGYERGGYPRNETVDFVFAAHGGSFFAIGVVGSLASLVFFSARMRTRAALGPILLGFAGSSSITLLALAAGAGVVWPLFAMAVITGSLSGALLLLARDRVKLDAEDPNAGAETFELRRLYGWLRAGVAYLLRALHPRQVVRTWCWMLSLSKWRRRGAFALGAALVFGVSAFAVVALAPERAVLASEWDVSTYGDLYDEADSDIYHRDSARQDGIAIERGPIHAVASDGGFLAYASFYGKSGVGSLKLDSDAWISRLPVGWEAHLLIELVEVRSTDEGEWREISITPAPSSRDVEPRSFYSSGDSHFFVVRRCDEDEKPRLGLEVLPVGGTWSPERHTVVVKITPSLHIADCAGY